MSWSEIPKEIFGEISKRLDVVDVIRSEKVCIWWRQSMRAGNMLGSQIPWLMLPWLSTGDDRKIKSRYFYCLTEHKIYELYLPEIAGQVCIGSSHGYLFSINCKADLIATNPLVKGACLPLPSTSTFPSVVRVVRNSAGRITKFKTKIDGVRWTSSRSHMLNFYYKKAVLSPAADTVAVIYRDTSLVPACAGDLAFARIGDRSWTVLKVPKAPPYLDDNKEYDILSYRAKHHPPAPKRRPSVDDIIFHKGFLHAVYKTGTLAIFDLDHPAGSPFISLEGSSDGKRYLVESPCGDKLFLVLRNLEYIIGSEFPRTNNFKIYMLDEAMYTWNRIKNLGDVSLFLGCNYSMSICTRLFPDIKRNCIYFIDDHEVDDCDLCYADAPKSFGDMGVFHLDDKTIGLLYPGSSINRLVWPPPVFFMLTLTVIRP